MKQADIQGQLAATGGREQPSDGSSWTQGAVRGGPCQGRGWQHTKSKKERLKGMLCFSSQVNTFVPDLLWSVQQAILHVFVKLLLTDVNLGFMPRYSLIFVNKLENYFALVL